MRDAHQRFSDGSSSSSSISRYRHHGCCTTNFCRGCFSTTVCFAGCSFQLCLPLPAQPHFANLSCRRASSKAAHPRAGSGEVRLREYDDDGSGETRCDRQSAHGSCAQTNEQCQRYDGGASCEVRNRFQCCCTKAILGRCCFDCYQTCPNLYCHCTSFLSCAACSFSCSHCCGRFFLPCPCSPCRFSRHFPKVLRRFRADARPRLDPPFSRRARTTATRRAERSRESAASAGGCSSTESCCAACHGRVGQAGPELHGSLCGDGCASQRQCDSLRKQTQVR